MRKALAAVVSIMALGGCQADDSEIIGLQRVELRAIESCEDLESVLRQNVIDEMRRRVMENYTIAINARSCDAYSSDSAAGDVWFACDESNGSTVCSSNSPAPGSQPDGGDWTCEYSGDFRVCQAGASEYSTTNTQEVGVDEADFIKNDGSFIYMIAGAELVIIDAWPPTVSEVVARVELEGSPRLLYVHENHVLIFTDDIRDDADESDCYFNTFSGVRTCGERDQLTRISIFNIADRSAPQLEREIAITGAYVNSRRIGDTVHTVLTYPELTFPNMSNWPDEVRHCSGQGREMVWNAFSQLIEENEAIITDTPLEEWLPTLMDTQHDHRGVASATTELLGSCKGYYEAMGSSGRSLLSVISFDLLDDDGAVNVSAIVGDQGVVYASREALYVASRQNRTADRPWYFEDEDEISEATTVHRFAFDLDSPSTTYEASGVVPGRILNQFSMGEHRGFLRMATTIGYLPSPDCSNNVYVLEPADEVLEIVGEVTGIAPTEDIRSARFVGDRGFIVTFKKTDPLFALDLSSPTDPRIVGELHIPGYSTYMQMMDSDHLMSIGFDAQDEGHMAWFQGVQLQIFDVSDMSNPIRTHLEIIGTRGTTSEATGNHLAFNYFAPNDLLAIPMAICEESEGGSDYGDVMTFNGLLVYDVTVDEGFSEQGRVSHGDAAEGYGCTNWWTDSNSQVKRSIIMDDFVFSVADDQIIVSNLDNLSLPLTSIDLSVISAP